MGDTRKTLPLSSSGENNLSNDARKTVPLPRGSNISQNNNFMKALFTEAANKELREVENKRLSMVPGNNLRPEFKFQSLRNLNQIQNPNPKSTTEQTLEKQKRMRNESFLELVKTERDYVEDLRIIIKAYYEPLQKQNIVSPRELTSIFSNIKVIIALNEQLLSDLQKIDSENQCVGPIFIKLADYLKMYTQYCAGQDECVSTLSTLEKSKAFAKFLDEKASDPLTRGLTLDGFLIKPIQRICKYPLLCRELLNFTEKDHPDYSDLEKALTKLSDVVNDVNEKKRQSENLQKMKEIQNLISKSGESIVLLQPQRQFVCEGAFGMVIKGKTRIRERHIFLFSDLLVYAKPRTQTKTTQRKKYSYRGIVDFQKALVRDGSDTSTHQFELIRLDEKKEIWMIHCTNAEEKQKWMTMINERIEKFLKRANVQHQAEKEKISNEQIPSIEAIQNPSESPRPHTPPPDEYTDVNPPIDPPLPSDLPLEEDTPAASPEFSSEQTTGTHEDMHETLPPSAVPTMPSQLSASGPKVAITRRAPKITARTRLPTLLFDTDVVQDSFKQIEENSASPIPADSAGPKPVARGQNLRGRARRGAPPQRGGRGVSSNVSFVPKQSQVSISENQLQKQAEVNVLPPSGKLGGHEPQDQSEIREQQLHSNTQEPSIRQDKDDICSVVDDMVVSVGPESISGTCKSEENHFVNSTVPPPDLPSQIKSISEYNGRQEIIDKQSSSPATSSGKHTEHTHLEMKKKFGSMIAGLAKSSKSKERPKERPKDKPKKEKKEKKENRTKQSFTTTDTASKESLYPNTHHFPSRPVSISRSLSSSVIPTQMSSSEKIIQQQPFTMNRPTQQITENTSLSRSGHGLRRPPPPIPAKRPHGTANSRGRGSFVSRDPTEITKRN